MKNRLLIGAAAAALTIAGAVAAQAADLPTRKEAPAPVFVPPPFSWTGFYVGLNAGGIWSSGSRSVSLFAPATFAFPITSDFPGGLGNGNGGFIGGGQADYNWQTGAFVLGVETDFDGTTLSGSRDVVGPTFGPLAGPFAGDFFTLHAKTSLD
jgi:outer membrane immunogenic protein